MSSVHRQINVRISIVKVIYTKHAEDKLKRADIRKFKINKKLIESSLAKSKHNSKTKHGDFSYLTNISPRHDLRIIYDIIGEDVKVITFHIARKGRYDKT